MQKPETIRLVAAEEDAGKRADRFLAERIGGISRSRVKSLIEAGHVRRGDVALVAPAEPVQGGARYEVVIPEAAPAIPQPEAIPFPILFEDSDLLVVDKPAGLVVHPAPGNETGTLVNAVIAHCGPSLAGVGGELRPGIVHRLDKDTSGVMVIAKNDFAMQALAALFAAREIEREYLALCWGLPSPAQGQIAGAIGRDPRERKRMAVRKHGGGKPALTRYQVRATFRGGAASLLECRLATGRTHQIRVHLAASGHPLVGDPLYLRRIPPAARLLAPPLRERLLDFPRQALHAARLGFAHPRSGEPLTFQTAPPADMQALLAALREGETGQNP